MKINLSKLHTHQQWPLAQHIVKKLTKQGHQALLAGGCVRDLLRGQSPKDLDIATDASPEVIETLFPKTVPVGKAFGTICVVEGNNSIEVTTFRSDGTYSDHRHPDYVEFGSLDGDAARRDFSINAMYFDTLNTRIIDFHNGQLDLQQKVIRCVGDPVQRFKDDKLRILRAIRFAVQLSFKIDPKTLQAMVSEVNGLEKISRERVVSECEKMFIHKNFKRALELLHQSGALQVLWPNLQLTVNWRDFFSQLSYYTLSGFSSVWTLIGYFELQRGQLSRFVSEISQWPFSRATHNAVVRVVENFSAFLDLDFYGKALMVDSNEGPIYLELWKLELLNTGQGFDSIDQFTTRFAQVCSRKGHLPSPFLSGEDLLQMGFSQGPRLGQVLSELHRQQVLGEITSRQQAEEWVKSLP